jgi:hypothetical protein
VGALLCGAALAGGCASSSSIVSDDEFRGAAADGNQAVASRADLLWERSLGARTGSTPNFYADTPGRRTFGILGVMAMAYEGNKLVSTYDIEDPAGRVSEELVASLAIQNRMRTTTRDQADLLLEVNTINWDFRPYRNNPKDLFVVYSARVNLRNRHDGTVLASGKCRSGRENPGDSATLDQLLAENASRLRRELREAAHECVQRLKGETFAAFLNNAGAVAQQVSNRRDEPRRQ